MTTWIQQLLQRCTLKNTYHPPNHTRSTALIKGVFGPQYPSLYEQFLAKRELREVEVMHEKRGGCNVLRQMATQLGRDFDADLAAARAQEHPLGKPPAA